MFEFNITKNANGFSYQVIEELKAHAQRLYPEECCGLIISGKYYPCENISNHPEESFRIASSEIILAGNKLEAICHSHPKERIARESEKDLARSQAFTVPWIIVAIYKNE